jgi:hypothetical protein
MVPGPAGPAGTLEKLFHHMVAPQEWPASNGRVAGKA